MLRFYTLSFYDPTMAYTPNNLVTGRRNTRTMMEMTESVGLHRSDPGINHMANCQLAFFNLEIMKGFRIYLDHTFLYIFCIYIFLMTLCC